jgi:hypothetical protein
MNTYSNSNQKEIKNGKSIKMNLGENKKLNNNNNNNNDNNNNNNNNRKESTLNSFKLYQQISFLINQE